MDPKESEKLRARDYYLQTDLTQQQICDLLDINRKTFHLWMKEGQWKRAKYVERHAPILLTEQYLNQLGELNLAVIQRTDRPYPTKEEAEIMRKISLAYKTIKGTENSVVDNIELFTDFSHELRMKDKNSLPDFIRPMDEYITKRFNEAHGLDKPFNTYLQMVSEDREYEDWHSTQLQSVSSQEAAAVLRPTINETASSVPLEKTTDTPQDFYGIRPMPVIIPANESAVPQQSPTPPNPGSPIHTEATDSSKNTRLIPFPNGVTDGATTTSQTTSKPLPTAQINENEHTDLPTIEFKNVDSLQPGDKEILAKDPGENNAATDSPELVPDSKLPIPDVTADIHERVTIMGVDVNKMCFQYNLKQMELPENERKLLTEDEFLRKHR